MGDASSSMDAHEHMHMIDPVYDERSRVLLLGSFPSPKSREMGFYYGHPQNRMWKVLARVMDEPVVAQTASERKAFLLRNRIAMWDVLARCSIEGASDASIRNMQPNDLSRIFDAASIERVFTTGAKATELYRRFILPACGIDCARLPSTSAANAAMRLDDLVVAYEVIRFAS
jgi:TDG/mug DNA glycosylase family protein